MKELQIEASLENIEVVTDFINKQLEEVDCPMKVQIQIAVAIDELMSNIARYAYTAEVGMVTVQFELKENEKAVIITFIDSGVPYDPLAKSDPDISLSAEDRDLGGLGIFMVKKTMDSMKYEYKNGHNILTIQKKL